MKAPLPTEKLTIRSSLDQLSVVDEWTERIAKNMGFTQSDISDLAICVTEAVNNAIIHAHHQDKRKTIVIHFEPQPDGLQVRVLDEGGGFDPEVLPNPTLPENIFKEGGRGIHVIRHLMDETKILPHKKGTEVVMLKLKTKRAS